MISTQHSLWLPQLNKLSEKERWLALKVESHRDLLLLFPLVVKSFCHAQKALQKLGYGKTHGPSKYPCDQILRASHLFFCSFLSSCLTVEDTFDDNLRFHSDSELVSQASLFPCGKTVW